MRLNDNQRILLVALLFLVLMLGGLAGIKADAADEPICPYRYLVLTPEDERLIAQCIEAECGTALYCGNGDYEEGIRCKIATCQVILNRILSGGFQADGDAQKVIRSHSQFSTYPGLLNAEPSEETYKVMYDTLMGENLQFGYDEYYLPLNYLVCYFSLVKVPGTTYVDKIGAHVFSK